MFQSILQETLAEENWQEVQKLGGRKIPALFPLGVIEEHGPHLPLGADIYWSCGMCRIVRDKLKSMEKKSVILPPYYWGVNHCTHNFPGTFSLRPQTMKQVLFEIFENVRDFSFHDVYCFNYHGDSYHVGAIADTIKEANEKLGISARLVLNEMDLPLFGWQGNEDFLLIVNPEYPMEWFEKEDASERGLLDIHAGAFETAAMNYFCPELVDLKIAEKLPSTSLDQEGLQKWLQGGDVTRESVPLGYAGNPAGYKAVGSIFEKILDLQAENIAKQIIQ